LQSSARLPTSSGRQDAYRPSDYKPAPSKHQSVLLPSNWDDSSNKSSTQTPSSDIAGNFLVIGFSPSLEGKIEPASSPAEEELNSESDRKDSGIYLEDTLMTSISLKQLPHSPLMGPDRVLAIVNPIADVLDEHIKEEALNHQLADNEATTTTEAGAGAEEDHAVGISSMTLNYVDEPLTHPSKAPNPSPLQINPAEGYRLHLKREDLGRMPGRTISWGAPGKELRIHLNTI
jgi:hypothetical protein